MEGEVKRDRSREKRRRREKKRERGRKKLGREINLFHMIKLFELHIPKILI